MLIITNNGSSVRYLGSLDTPDSNQDVRLYTTLKKMGKEIKIYKDIQNWGIGLSYNKKK